MRARLSVIWQMDQMLDAQNAFAFCIRDGGNMCEASGRKPAKDHWNHVILQKRTLFRGQGILTTKIIIVY